MTFCADPGPPRLQRQSAVPLHLTFLLRWGGDRKLLEMPEPPLNVPWAQSIDLSSQAQCPGQDTVHGRTQGAAASWSGLLAAAAAARGSSSPAPRLAQPRATGISPPALGGRLGEVGGRCTQQPTPSAKSACRVGDAGGRGRVGLAFFLFKAFDLTTKFPGRRLCPRVGASRRRSFPSLHPAPRRPSEPEPQPWPGRALGPPVLDPAPERRACLPAALPGLRGGASPRGETRRPGAL